jgi:hypothetical protein
MKKDNSKKDKIHANFLISDRIKEIEKMLWKEQWNQWLINNYIVWSEKREMFEVKN